MNNFKSPCFFRILHIIVKKLNFGFLTADISTQFLTYTFRVFFLVLLQRWDVGFVFNKWLWRRSLLKTNFIFRRKTSLVDTLGKLTEKNFEIQRNYLSFLFSVKENHVENVSTFITPPWRIKYWNLKIYEVKFLT